MNEQNKAKYENFFTPLANRSPYFKLNSMGEAGSGKTFTLHLIAIGLHEYIGSTKPIVIFDTELSSKFLAPAFAEAGIEVIVKESRTLPDLVKTFQFCNEGGSDILFIDSITHVWEDFLNDYQLKKQRSYLQFQDWGVIKPTWKREFSNRLVQSRCHVMFTGRQGYTYDYEEIDGKKTLVKTGLKMQAERETPYEPDVLLLMERHEELLDRDNRKVWREATVLKDRSNLIDGRTFKNASFTDFKPVVDYLIQNVKAPVQTASTPNDELFTTVEDNSEERKRKQIVIERVQGFLDKVASGTSSAAKAMRIGLTEQAYYGEQSETAIAAMTIQQHEEAESKLSKLVDVIVKIQRGENKIYASDKVIETARKEKLETTNLGECQLDVLQIYLDSLVEIFNANKKKVE